MNKYLAATVEEINVAGKKIVTVKEMEIGVFYIGGQYYAWRNMCPHAGAPVCKGLINGTTLPTHVYEYEFGCEGQILRCPWHGWEFDLTDGRHLAADSKAKLRGYPTAVEEGLIYIMMA
ncbi:Rieske 2Fe-2S domain-containing protein [Paenibacillus sp. LMG 31456]|uniref:Rieske 2Fe-2S domain-containing protein n=1 Tax=Paenibacillus foliorum TaxID=2654974 RepID=A0A972K156_9BACL|nr:Rieske (2Fe-2S) protein [Paenibacillus foliorum]NOU94510.1 Rieske 2Fe-2S domain-containing protein [Paenibacillus foliorum]